jgi:hypothetical protein
MKSIALILFISLLAAFNLQQAERKTTYEERFEDEYQVEHLRAGDGVTYPQNYKWVRMRFKGFIPATGQVFDSSDLRGGFYEFQQRRETTLIKTPVVHPPCWDQTYPRMSTGEKIVIICNSEQAFGNRGIIVGAKVIVKPGESVAYEIEMVNAQYDPFNFKLIRKGVGKDHPKYHDLIKYNLVVWVDQDREHIVTTWNSGNGFTGGSSFDHSDNVCMTETLRQLTVGGIAEVTCPYRYLLQGGVVFPEHGIGNHVNVSFRVQLLSIKQLHHHHQK